MNKYNTSIDLNDKDSIIDISYNNESIYISTYNKMDSTYRIYSNDKYGSTTLIRGFKVKY